MLPRYYRNRSHVRFSYLINRLIPPNAHVPPRTESPTLVSREEKIPADVTFDRTFLARYKNRQKQATFERNG